MITVVLSLALTVLVAIHGPVTLQISLAPRLHLGGLVGNHLSTALLDLITSIGAISIRYSRSYLRNDPHASTFYLHALVLIGAMSVVVCSLALSWLVVAWIVAGRSFVRLIGYRSDLPGVTESRHRTQRVLRLGDLALIFVLTVVSVRVGNLDLTNATAVHRATALLGAWRAPIALALVLSALVRSAQGPFGRWLPGTVCAPTPVSALLHAGFVNGGAILLLRVGDLYSASRPATVVTLVVGVTTAITATAAIGQSPDIKSSLVLSTMGQMGFMLAECAVGLSSVALVHLIGHAIYKATRFLGAGSGIDRIPFRHTSPLSPRSVGAILRAASAGALATLLIASCLRFLTHASDLPLLFFIGLTATLFAYAIEGAMDHLPHEDELRTKRSASAVHYRRGRIASTVRALIVLAVAGVIYGSLAGVLTLWLSSALTPPAAALLNPWWLLVIVAASLTFEGARRLPLLRRRIDLALWEMGSPAPINIRHPALSPRRRVALPAIAPRQNLEGSAA
jgi:NADH:ubiquinone oxidoreductase subunit 5 (subunit L)/multisubunit Na+/H+ antiporter MnhA subunit